MEPLNHRTTGANIASKKAHPSVTGHHTAATSVSTSKSGSLPTALAAGDRLLRLHQVLSKFPVGRSTWYAGMRTGRYPQSVRISQRAVGWSCAAIDALIARQVNQICSVGLPHFAGA